MSTSSQLRFGRPDRDDATGVAQVDKHSDGYPSAVAHLLVELADLLHATETLCGPTDAAAQCLFLDTCSVIPLYLPADDDRCDESRAIDISTPLGTVQADAMAELDQPLFLLGNAVEDPATGIRGDEAFLHEVDILEGPSAALKECTVQVSAPCGFPRRDGPTAAAFEQATWQFEGMLPAAHDTFVDNSA